MASDSERNLEMMQDSTTVSESGRAGNPGSGGDIVGSYRLSEEFDKLKESTIMMVDDEPLTMEVVKVFLEDAGYRNFILVEDSVQAMTELERHRPDVLLLDVVMPKVSGFDILRQLRATSEFAHLPVIILTSSSDAETKLQALDIGATDFLAKPVDPSELALRVRNTLAVKAYQDQLAYYDGVTGLPNKVLFLDQLNWALQRAHRQSSSMALLQIDLDHFKRIVDTFGPKVGDQVVQQVAQRLQDSVRDSDVVSHGIVTEEPWGRVFRLGTENFSVLCPSISSSANAAVVANRILEVMQEPFDAEDTEVSIAPSIGIVCYPDDGDDSAELIKHAVGAAGHAHANGGSCFEFYSSELNAKSIKRLRVEAALRRATENDRLVLHYQPKVNINTGAITSLEGLLRWKRDDGTFVAPGDFIPVAEESGLIMPMGQWVIEQACRQMAEWQAQGIEVKVSVNVSAKQFFGANLQQVVSSALADNGVAPGHLTLEVTESLLIENTATAIDLMNRLRSLGVKISIDDFGTGYSSLMYLKQLPVDELKIDRSFIVDVTRSRKELALVKATIFIAHELGLSVVAEGVEERKQLDCLSAIKCDEYQGYLFSRPVTVQDMTQMLSMDEARAI